MIAKFLLVILLLGFSIDSFIAEPRSCRDMLSESNVLAVTNGEIGYETSKSSYHVYEEGTTFGLDAYLSDNGNLKIFTFLVDDYRNIRSRLRGRDLFDAVIKHFGIQNIKTFEADWRKGSTNYLQYRKAINDGKSPKEAALSTWSGLQAKKHGLSRVVSVRENVIVDEFDGEDGIIPVLVIFSK